MRRYAPLWVYTGAFGLASVAGSINAFAWLGVEHKGVTHVTGAFTEAATQLALANPGGASLSLVVVACFGVGAVFSGVLLGDSSLKLGRRYGVGLMVESGLLVLAYLAARAGSPLAADCLAATACGLQNALATGFSGAVLRTTHMTGVVTDLGLLLGHALRGGGLDLWRLWVYVALVSGFSLGGLGGALASTHLGPSALLIPAGALFAGGFAYWVWRHRRRDQPHEHTHPGRAKPRHLDHDHDPAV